MTRDRGQYFLSMYMGIISMENNKDILGIWIDLCEDLSSLNYENKMVI